MTTAEQNKRWAETLIDILYQKGVSTLCIAPGSRSTPLTLAAANHPKIETLIHFDERALGYLALGIAASQKKPVAILVTSGSAVANLLPSIIEAKYSQIPLVILTADRPPELQQCGANQTINQYNLFQNFVSWETHLPCPTQEIDLRYLSSLLSQALRRCHLGAVHINCMFREPFFPSNASLNIPFQKPFSPSWTEGKLSFSSLQLDSFAKKLKGKGIILIGRLFDPLLTKAILSLAKKLNWPVFSDLLSQSRSLDDTFPSLPFYDYLLEKEKPDLILHFGDRFISKKLFSWIATVKPSSYISISSQSEPFDPHRLFTDYLEIDPLYFCREMTSRVTPQDPNWLNSWREKQKRVEEIIEEFFKQESLLSEPLFAWKLGKAFPKDTGIFFANSMPIRDGDRFFYPAHPPVYIHANRGHSGIDGNIATSFGLSLGSEKRWIGVLGDLSFLHDSSSLSLFSSIKKPFHLFVLNNQGGGIFSHLPIAQSPHFEKYFATPHSYNFEHLANQFSIPYQKLSSLSFSCLENFSGIIEVPTNRHLNKQVYERLEKTISEKLCCSIPV